MGNVPPARMRCVDDEALDAGDLVEVARAHDRLEAIVWSRNLEQLGIPVSTETKGNWLTALLYLGRVPVAVRVPRRDRERALDYLKKYRFI
jgi:hypothetical protein